jgi:hypothetical protein
MKLKGTASNVNFAEAVVDMIAKIILDAVH